MCHNCSFAFKNLNKLEIRATLLATAPEVVNMIYFKLFIQAPWEFSSTGTSYQFHRETILIMVIWTMVKKNVAAFCLCPKNLPEATLKSFELISLAEEISRQPSINHVM